MSLPPTIEVMSFDSDGRIASLEAYYEVEPPRAIEHQDVGSSSRPERFIRTMHRSTGQTLGIARHAGYEEAGTNGLPRSGQSYRRCSANDIVNNIVAARPDRRAGDRAPFAVIAFVRRQRCRRRADSPGSVARDRQTPRRMAGLGCHRRPVQRGTSTVQEQSEAISRTTRPPTLKAVRPEPRSLTVLMGGSAATPAPP
jgi:hypothetical protein